MYIKLLSMCLVQVVAAIFPTIVIIISDVVVFVILPLWMKKVKPREVKPLA